MGKFKSRILHKPFLSEVVRSLEGRNSQQKAAYSDYPCAKAPSSARSALRMPGRNCQSVSQTADRKQSIRHALDGIGMAIAL